MHRDDEELQEKVIERLYEDPTINADSIEARVRDGHIILHGTVESRDDRKWIEALVRQIPEVVDVLNYLTVDRDAGPESPDDRPSL